MFKTFEHRLSVAGRQRCTTVILLMPGSSVLTKTADAVGVNIVDVIPTQTAPPCTLAIGKGCKHRVANYIIYSFGHSSVFKSLFVFPNYSAPIGLLSSSCFCFFMFDDA